MIIWIECSSWWECMVVWLVRIKWLVRLWIVRIHVCILCWINNMFFSIRVMRRHILADRTRDESICWCSCRTACGYIVSINTFCIHTANETEKNVYKTKNTEWQRSKLLDSILTQGHFVAAYYAAEHFLHFELVSQFFRWRLTRTKDMSSCCQLPLRPHESMLKLKYNLLISASSCFECSFCLSM